MMWVPYFSMKLFTIFIKSEISLQWIVCPLVQEMETASGIYTKSSGRWMPHCDMSRKLAAQFVPVSYLTLSRRINILFFLNFDRNILSCLLLVYIHAHWCDTSELTHADAQTTDIYIYLSKTWKVRTSLSPAGKLSMHLSICRLLLLAWSGPFPPCTRFFTPHGKHVVVVLALLEKDRINHYYLVTRWGLRAVPIPSSQTLHLLITSTCLHPVLLTVLPTSRTSKVDGITKYVYIYLKLNSISVRPDTCSTT